MIPEIFSIVLLFLFGICSGSFINVVIDRHDRPFSILRGRSYCFNCKKKLAVIDLIPLFSFLVLRGRCRYCQHKIPVRNFVVEIICGLLFVIVGLLFLPNFVQVGVLLMLTGILLSLFFIDFESGILPDYLLIALLVVGLGYVFPLGYLQIGTHILMGLGLFGLFLLLFVITRARGIGFGDVKFAFVIGFLLGFPSALLAVYLAFVIGAVMALFLIAMGRKRLRGDSIAFGPFLVLGVLTMLLFSEEIFELTNVFF